MKEISVLSLLAALLLFAGACSPALWSGGQARIEVYFVPEEDFASYLPAYEPTNYGYFYVFWNSAGEIYRARVLISTTEITQEERSHLIWEELTQSLGLMNDSCRYPGSIFYEGWTDTTGYDPIDRTVIEILYREDVRPGMTPHRLAATLEGEYTQEELDYFDEIAFGPEYGESDERLHKWERSPIVEVHGSPTEMDMDTLHKVIAELNGLTGEVRLTLEGEQ